MVTHIFPFPVLKSVLSNWSARDHHPLRPLAKEEEMIFIKQVVLAGVRPRSVATA